MVIPQLITLLNQDEDSIRSATVSALAKLADHGEFVVVHSSDMTNTGMKSSFARQLGRSFHCSLRC